MRLARPQAARPAAFDRAPAAQEELNTLCATRNSLHRLLRGLVHTDRQRPARHRREQLRAAFSGFLLADLPGDPSFAQALATIHSVCSSRPFLPGDPSFAGTPSSQLQRGSLLLSRLRPSRAASDCLQRVAPGSAPSCTAAHSRLALLHIGESRVAQLAAAPRPLTVPLRAWRSAWFSPKLHGGPQPPRITPPRSVACSTARRCAAALGRPAAGMA